MSLYSKSELQVMRSAFKSLFNVSDACLDTPEVNKWMEEAPVTIVEFDGKLKNEGRQEKDKRMEIIDVYDGNISMLVEHLRRLYKEYRKLTKWELIFKVNNEILAASKAIEQAELSLILEDKKEVAEEPIPQVVEELQTNPSSSTEESVSVPEPVKVDKEPITETTESTQESDLSQESHEEKREEVSEVKPSGNVQEPEMKPLLNNKIATENKEDNSMSEIDEMLAAAQKAAGEGTGANPANEQVAPGAANVSTVKGADNEAKAKVAELLASQKDQRNAWTRANAVTAIISTMQPSALRTKGNMGVAVAGETDAEKALEEINKKINKFIVMVSGKEGITQDAFEALPDEEKYANVVVKADTDNIGKAAAMYDLYKRIKQNPLGEVAAFIPSADKVNYPVRGYMIGSTPYPEQEFILQIIDNGTGAIYGEGSMDENGNDVGTEPVIFKIGTAKRQEKAVSTGISANVKSNKVPVVRPVNKRKFIAGGNHVNYLFTQVDTENDGAAAFKAAIQVGGELMGATVSVYNLENGKKQVRSTKEDGTVTYKTKVASINVSVPVQKIKKEFEATFRTADEDILVTAGRWGVQMRVDKQKGNFGNIDTFSAAPILDVFAEIYAGAIKLPDAIRSGSESVKVLQAAADKQAEADAAQSATELV